jgi:hypothetical protein
MAPEHMDGGKPFLHPESVGVDRRNTLKVIALDAATGSIVWERVAYDGPMFDNRHLLLTSEDGETFFVRAGPTHEVVKTNSVDEPVYSTLALANGRIYIRGERHVFAIK